MTDAQFESDGATPQGAVDNGTYEQALFALKYNQGVAENVLARRAKRDFRATLKREVKLRETDDDIVPVWVDHHTVVLDASAIPKEQPSDDAVGAASLRLEGLVRRLVLAIQDTCPENRTVLLIGALWVRVQDLGGGRYSFSLKQKWGIDDR
jgi:hypothetical protein